MSATTLFSALAAKRDKTCLAGFIHTHSEGGNSLPSSASLPKITEQHKRAQTAYDISSE